MEQREFLVASKIADRVGITRSVIVNALRKFESAGVIESRSSGMKGTYIKVLNDYVFTELEKNQKRKTFDKERLIKNEKENEKGYQEADAPLCKRYRTTQAEESGERAWSDKEEKRCTRAIRRI